MGGCIISLSALWGGGEGGGDERRREERGKRRERREIERREARSKGRCRTDARRRRRVRTGTGKVLMGCVCHMQVLKYQPADAATATHRASVRDPTRAWAAAGQ